MKVSIAYQWKRKSKNYNPKNPKALIDYSQTIDDVYENLEMKIYENLDYIMQ